MRCILSVAVGIFGQKWLGGLGGVSFISQLIGTALAIAIALAGGFIVYGILKRPLAFAYLKKMSSVVQTYLFIRSQQTLKKVCFNTF